MVDIRVLRYINSPEGRRVRDAILDANRRLDGAQIEKNEKQDARRWLLITLSHVAQRQRQRLQNLTQQV